LRGIGIKNIITRARDYLTGAMHRRLVIYTFVLVFFVGVIFMGAATVFGRFSYVEQRTAETLSLQLAVFERDVTNHFDFIAARGIKFSGEITDCLEGELKARGISFASLNGNPDAIAGMQTALYDTLYHALELADCSGVFYLLDATANTSLPGADRSKSGMYVKIANVNVTRPANPKLALFRGYADAGSKNFSLEYHNMWALEFNADLFPDYDLLMEKANKNLNSCFLFTDTVKLTGTWENVILLCVPIVGRDGTVYGICGFEISQLYFKLRHAQTGAVPHMTGLLTRNVEDGLDADSGFECGDRMGFFTEITGMMASSPSKGFSFYKSDEGEFVGAEMKVRLSPLEQMRSLAIMMPKADYDAARADSMKENIVIVALLILTAVFGSIFMSRIYIRPILHGLKQASDGQSSGGGVRIQEIDDLLLYLKDKDEKRGELAAELEQAKKLIEEYGADSETGQGVATPSDYWQFLENLKTLTKTEHAVFDRYMKDMSAQEIASDMFVSISTIRHHNKNIYRKLGVSSLNALRVYIGMMKEMRDGE